jgi:malonate decarboxylase gamma subunit
MCLDLARRKGHKVIGLVYDQALSGGFITTGLIADACYALPEAEIRVMRIPAMARVTKLPEAMLEELAQSNPVFAPGVGNYVAMGGIQSVWDSSSPEQLRASLRAALAQSNDQDRRASDGAERGGRRLAAQIIEQVLQAS